MLKNIMGNKKMMVKIIIAVVVAFGLFVTISLLDAYVLRPGTPDYVTSDQLKDEPKQETKKVSEEAKQTKQEVSNDWINYAPTTFDIILRNNEIQLSPDEEAYANLTPVEDDYNTDRRFIIPEIDASIKIYRRDRTNEKK